MHFVHIVQRYFIRCALACCTYANNACFANCAFALLHCFLRCIRCTIFAAFISCACVYALDSSTSWHSNSFAIAKNCFAICFAVCMLLAAVAANASTHKTRYLLHLLRAARAAVCVAVAVAFLLLAFAVTKLCAAALCFTHYKYAACVLTN